jgi:hypothetical protein
VTPLTLRCSGSRCRTVAGSPTARTIMLRGRSLSLPLPARGHGIRVKLATAAFQLGDAPWTAASTTISYLRR